MKNKIVRKLALIGLLLLTMGMAREAYAVEARECFTKTYRGYQAYYKDYSWGCYVNPFGPQIGPGNLIHCPEDFIQTPPQTIPDRYGEGHAKYNCNGENGGGGVLVGDECFTMQPCLIYFECCRI